MAKHKRTADRTHLVAHRVALGIAWSCRACNANGIAPDPGTAYTRFDNHPCEG